MLAKFINEELRVPERQEFLRWLLFQIYFQSTLICFPFHFNPQRGKHLRKIPVVSICKHASQLNKTPSIEASYPRANGIIWVGAPNLNLSLRPDSLDLPKIAFKPSLLSSPLQRNGFFLEPRVPPWYRGLPACILLGSLPGLMLGSTYEYPVHIKPARLQAHCLVICRGQLCPAISF